MEYIGLHNSEEIAQQLSNCKIFYDKADIALLESIESHCRDPSLFKVTLFKHCHLGRFNSKVDRSILDHVDDDDLLYYKLCHCNNDGSHPLYHFRNELLLREYLIRVTSVSKRQHIIMGVRDLYHKTALDNMSTNKNYGYEGIFAMLLLFCKEYSITSPGSLLLLSITSELQLQHAELLKLKPSVLEEVAQVSSSTML